MLFITLVAFSALFVAGCAAFFSIKGLIVLFSGSALAIGIMASSLEIGKLVAASFLHSQWKRISFLLKTYLCLAVLVLMCITSLGIFGFLTGAYQVHSSKVGTFDTRITALTSEKTTIAQTILEQSDRIKILAEVRTAQEQRVQAAGNFKAPRDQAYKAIAEANEEIQKKEAVIAQGRQRSVEIDQELAELKITLNTTTDIGSFKFIADALNTSVDKAVQYFIFTLIAVFDPLAVALVLAWNKLLELRAAKKNEDDFVYLSSLGIAATEELQTPLKKTTKVVAVENNEEQLITPPVAELSSITPVETACTVIDVANPVEKEIEETPAQAASLDHQSDMPLDPVSGLPVGMEYSEELENDPTFTDLSEELKKIIRGRKRSAWKNTTVISRG